MRDNIIATIIFIMAIAGLIGLVVYKLRKDNNNEKVRVEDFLGLYYNNLFNVIQDVVSLLSINIDDFETKEDYERAIISTTIAKLEENCDEFGISSALFKLVDREVLTNVLYDILYTNKVQIFFSTLPEKIIKNKPELYDDEVINAFENAEPVLHEDEDTHTEPQEEPKHEEEEVAKQEEETTNVSNNEEIEEVEKAKIVNKEDTALPPREAYYGKRKEDIEISADAFENTEQILNNHDPFADMYVEIDPAAETDEHLTDLTKIPSADVDSAMHSINAALMREDVDRA